MIAGRRAVLVTGKEENTLTLQYQYAVSDLSKTTRKMGGRGEEAARKPCTIEDWKRGILS